MTPYSVKQRADKEILLSVRSRADKKKPTCTADIKAFQQNGNTYTGVVEGKNIIISFTAGAVTIATEKKEDEGTLAFFCSGGGTLAGTYNKINEPLDVAQMDKTDFIKVLRLQDLGLTVSSIKKNEQMELSTLIVGPGVKDTKPHTQLFDGYVNDAEVNDLNSDGNPELVVYTVSQGTGRFGNVIAYSIDKNGKITTIEFPDIRKNAAINKEYGGQDEFSLVENILSHRFPLYKDGDANSTPTGGTRQVSYKMVKAGKGYKFEVATTTDSK